MYSKIVALLRQCVLPLYRVFSMFSLYAILFLILGFSASIAFYTVSDSWAVPFNLKSTDDKVLVLTNQLMSAQASETMSKLDYEKTVALLAANKTQIEEYRRFEAQVLHTISAQKKDWLDSTKNLGSLEKEKQEDNAQLTADLAHQKILRDSIESELRAGLMTKTDAAATLSQLDTFRNSATDSRIAEVLLPDVVRQHKMSDLNTVSAFGLLVQVRAMIEQLQAVIVSQEEELKLDQSTIDSFEKVITTAKNSPYYEAVNADKNLQLAVLPYSGGTTIKEGEPVYDCLLGIALCRKVGSVVKVFGNEQMFEEPTLRINVRGYIIKLAVPETAARSSVLMIGRKPLLF